MGNTRVVDINCDLGESFGAYVMGRDEDVIPHITSANIACGFHAGDPAVMRRTVGLAARFGIHVGAHPGFNDLFGFGRRTLAATPDEVYADTLYQLGALEAFCRAEGTRLHHVKPHGALYNMAAVDPKYADAICAAIAAYDSTLILLALSGSEMVRAAARAGIGCSSEVFADRSYQPDGTLAPRSMPGSMIEDENSAISRAVRMVIAGKVADINGDDIEISADSICVHGDSAHALDFVRNIRAALIEAGVRIAPLHEVVGATAR